MFFLIMALSISIDSTFDHSDCTVICHDIRPTADQAVMFCITIQLLLCPVVLNLLNVLAADEIGLCGHLLTANYVSEHLAVISC